MAGGARFSEVLQGVLGPRPVQPGLAERRLFVFCQPRLRSRNESYSSKSTTSPYFALVTARASASTSRRKRSSLGTVRMHSGRTPMIIAARLRALWLWSLMYHVYGRALGVAGRFPRRYQGVDAGRRPPAGQKTSRILRIAEPTPKPVDDDQLELAGTTRDQPGALVDVVSGGHKVGYHPGPGG